MAEVYRSCRAQCFGADKAKQRSMRDRKLFLAEPEVNIAWAPNPVLHQMLLCKQWSTQER